VDENTIIIINNIYNNYQIGIQYSYFFGHSVVTANGRVQMKTVELLKYASIIIMINIVIVLNNIVFILDLVPIDYLYFQIFQKYFIIPNT